MNSVFLPALYLSAALMLASVVPADAKRLMPKPVKPVVASVRYSAPAEFMGFVIATDVSTHKELWRRRIYHVFVNPIVETDAQMIFITSLTLTDHSLLITDERGRQFTLDLTTRAVRRLK